MHKRHTEQAPDKPTWPYSGETTMTPHPCGQWCKSHKRKLYYFGTWAYPQAALARWRAEWPSIVAGGDRVGHTTGRGAITVLDLCTEFLRAKETTVSPITFADYDRTTRRICAKLGTRCVHLLTPADFANLLRDQSTGIYDRHKFVVWTRNVFKWGYEAGLIDPVRFGPEFKPYKAKDLRRHKRETQGPPFTKQEIAKLIRKADPLMRAAIYLGLNGGYEPKQLCTLRGDHIDREARCINTIRDKTETPRVVPLWPETMTALRAVYQDGLIFTSRNGLPLSHGTTRGLTRRFTRLLESCKLHTRGRSFYHLRRTFATCAAEAADKDASKVIVGHALREVHDGYVLTFPKERLRLVVNHVRHRLLGIKP